MKLSITLPLAVTYKKFFALLYLAFDGYLSTIITFPITIRFIWMIQHVENWSKGSTTFVFNVRHPTGQIFHIRLIIFIPSVDYGICSRKFGKFNFFIIWPWNNTYKWFLKQKILQFNHKVVTALWASQPRDENYKTYKFSLMNFLTRWYPTRVCFLLSAQFSFK